MEINKVYLGDALEVVKTFPDESVNCVVTSPPYYALRDYGMNGQIGCEDTPEEYVSKLVLLFREAKRVLRADGTIWVNIGDTYYGGGKTSALSDSGAGNKQQGNKGSLSRVNLPNNRKRCGVYKPKDLIGVPWMLALAMRNDGWYLRQDIIWSKPNAMPESVTDRCTKSHEYIFLMSKSERYFFDAKSISEPIAGASVQNLTEMRNKRDVWSVNTKPLKEAHFATFPPTLIQPCILAGCPEGGIVLDPFIGSGTTGLVARMLNRNFVGIELNPEYQAMATRRIMSEGENLFNQ